MPDSRTFPKRLRIRSSREYREHRRRSRTFRTRRFIVAWAPAMGDDGRLGMAVSRKVGGAVVRNRVKRVLREWYRLNRHELGEPWDMVVIARPQAAEIEGLTDVTEELVQLLQWLNNRRKA